MAPRARRYDDAAVRTALEAQWRRLVPAVDAALAAGPDAPSRLPGWSVTDLAAHVTGTVQRLVAALAAPAPGRATLRLTDHYAGYRDEPPEVEPPPGPAATVADAMAALASAPAERLVRVGSGDLRLTDYLVTRVVEAVTHGRDLPEPVEPEPAALRIAAQALADMLAAREPGRTVEVRVPPYAAVQCVAGPVHTRGTPPNVVEAEPLAWLEVATGRLAWAAAVAAGRITASGNRADLSPYLPLL